MFFPGFGFTAILLLANDLALIALLVLAAAAWWMARKHERFCDEDGCEIVRKTEEDYEGDGEEYHEAHYSG